ncbi:JAB domain-containing protein [Sphingomonas chungangi]|uniref:JAB domain-containing protein n=1 Tax=Sphingomonas chungangi TaxID=2683589 RepID=UPI0031B6026C
MLEDVISLCAPEAAADLADRLIARFGSTGAVFAAHPSDRAAIVGQDAVARVFDLVIRAMRHALHEKAMKRPVLADQDALMAYLAFDLQHAPAECLRVLFLNARNELLSEELAFQGTINRVHAYPREIVRKALETQATALLLVHNHPSGDPTPSREDIRLTHAIHAALRPLDIRLHDHLIIARSGTVSLRVSGYLSDGEES